MKYHYFVILYDFRRIKWDCTRHRQLPIPESVSDVNDTQIDIDTMTRDLEIRPESKSDAIRGILSVIYDRQEKEYKILAKVLYKIPIEKIPIDENHIINHGIETWLNDTEHTSFDIGSENTLYINIK